MQRFYWSGFDIVPSLKARELKEGSGRVIGISDAAREFNVAGARVNRGNFRKLDRESELL